MYSQNMKNTKFATPSRLNIKQIQEEKDQLSEHVCSNYFNFFPLPLIIINSYRQIIFCNNAFLEILGINDLGKYLGQRPGEVLGCIYSHIEKNGCGTSEYCRECGALHAVLESIGTNKKSQHECQLLISYNHEIIAKDFSVYSSPWTVEKNQYYVVTFLDIESEKRRRVLERIFFHDILNSAAGAKGVIDLLLDDVADIDKEMVSLAQAAIFGLIEEIKKQKQLLAVESREYTIAPITLQGSELLRLVASEYRNHPVARDKTINIDPTSCNIQVFSDYTLLRRVLINMTINALESTPRGGEVIIGLDRQNDSALFWVKNSQIIPDDIQLQIFKRSFSTKGKDRGLGTYSIKLLTENYLGGEVGFSSQEPDGTIFWIKLKIK